jgi:hypothetical protein
LTISTADPGDPVAAGTVGELAVTDSSPGLDGAGADPGRSGPAVLELAGMDVELVVPGGVEVAVRAVRTALLQPARPAAVSRRPAEISERRDSILRTSPG